MFVSTQGRVARTRKSKRDALPRLTNALRLRTCSPLDTCNCRSLRRSKLIAHLARVETRWKDGTRSSSNLFRVPPSLYCKSSPSLVRRTATRSSFLSNLPAHSNPCMSSFRSGVESSNLCEKDSSSLHRWRTVSCFTWPTTSPLTSSSSVLCTALMVSDKRSALRRSSAFRRAPSSVVIPWSFSDCDTRTKITDPSPAAATEPYRSTFSGGSSPGTVSRPWRDIGENLCS
mmetsp:Transcript_50366/g.133756  ORF Transcript_50366/g.133756 Transcript_50366/m.133756 type:complete len:230 (+) Transcript_50366:1996-2685(+)